MPWNAAERWQLWQRKSGQRNRTKSITGNFVMISVRRCNRCGDLFDVDKTTCLPSALSVWNATQSKASIVQDKISGAIPHRAMRISISHRVGQAHYHSSRGMAKFLPMILWKKNWIDLSQKPQRSIQKNEKKRMTAFWLHF